MRDLQQSDKNSITVDDRLSGTQIEMYYRMPTTTERVEYQRALIKRQGNKVRMQVFEARVEYGLKIITGFAEGAFGIAGAAISSDPASPSYKADWKDLLRNTASDIVAAVAAAVYESAVVGGESNLEFMDEGEDDLPL